MPGYILAKVNVTDMKKYQEYLKVTPATIAKHGGKFIVRGGEMETLEGAPVTERIVVLEFPSYQKAKEWYRSTDYQNAKKLREGAAEASFIAINGVPL
jgi:uncharacterized protein (DUF1330 family)